MSLVEFGRARLGRMRCKAAGLCISGVLLDGVSVTRKKSISSYADEDVGVMIGEMWDLERLCEKAEQLGRHTCFVSSVPLKVSVPHRHPLGLLTIPQVPGGVASPPNAVAIF